MKNSAIIAGALVFALSACSDVPRKSSDALSVSPSNTVYIDVSIRGGNIEAPHEVDAYARHTDIQWTIRTSGNYTFPRHGIVIDAGHFKCPQNQAGSKTFTCTKIGHKPGRYKYIVNVDDGTNPLLPLPLNPLDPWINNL